MKAKRNDPKDRINVTTQVRRYLDQMRARGQRTVHVYPWDRKRRGVFGEAQYALDTGNVYLINELDKIGDRTGPFDYVELTEEQARDYPGAPKGTP